MGGKKKGEEEKEKKKEKKRKIRKGKKKEKTSPYASETNKWQRRTSSPTWFHNQKALL